MALAHPFYLLIYPAFISLAVFALAAVPTVCIWLESSMMGAAGFVSSVAEVGVGRVCLALAATFALALTPLAVGFTLPSLGAREELLNGVGNPLSMFMTFLAVPGCCHRRCGFGLDMCQIPCIATTRPR